MYTFISYCVNVLRSEKLGVMVELTTPYFLIPPTVNFQHTMFNHAVVTNSITN